ncbi:hypothetical protein [Halobacteriovorax sp.]|uniref:hypothetical protein n=1 Tax=Halobacteriovorax sp. TaxID=2020862 RepID=UPI00356AB47D
MTSLKYFKDYFEEIISKVNLLVDSNILKSYLLNKYPNCHSIRLDKLLFEFTNNLKVELIKKAPPLSKVIYEKKYTKFFRKPFFYFEKSWWKTKE